MHPIVRAAVLGIILACVRLPADWPTLRGNAERTGRVDAPLPTNLKAVWAVEFEGERLGTAMEPVIARGRVFVATHSGRVWALDITTGTPAWRFEARAPILHSPAVHDDTVVVATSAGSIFAIHPVSGGLLWHHDGDPAGYSASPLLIEDQVLIGSRGGLFSALDLASGETIWDRDIRVPIRQSAAAIGDRLWFTGEDLVTRCLSRRNGRRIWASPPAPGQSARDYYPVLSRHSDRTWVAVRTAPYVRMSDRIARDRAALARNASPDLTRGDWRQIEAWTTNAASTATPERTRREQTAIRAHLDSDPDARTFHLYDAATGRPSPPVPVLWVGGCQGVPTPPVVLPDGRFVTVLRSAYGHWSLGVAPLVGVGRFDPATLEMELLNQLSGPKPPWNTFWGTADEAQNLVVFTNATVFVHQGTLSRYDPDTGRLSPISGARDTFGGLRPPAWARNEWHGPARGGIAWSDNRLFWMTGSRVLCLAPHGTEALPRPRTLLAADHPVGGRLPTPAAPNREDLQRLLARRIRELLRDPAEPWAPLTVMPGLDGGAVLFDQPSDLAGTLAQAWPHLDATLKERVSAWLGDLASTNAAPFVQTTAADHAIPRHYHPRPAPRDRHPPAVPGPQPPGFASLAALIQGCRLIDPEALEAHWPEWVEVWHEFRRTGWRLDPNRGDLHANRILSSLLAFAELALEQGEPELHAAASDLAEQTAEGLVAWWVRSAGDLRLEAFQGIQDLDAFIGKGDGLFYRVAPHRHRLALFQDLTPPIARLLRDRAPAAVDTLWRAFERLCPTWWLVGEERQVHGGENLFDPPDFAMAGFRALATLRNVPPAELAARIDIPACRADLHHVTRIAIALDAMSR